MTEARQTPCTGQIRDGVHRLPIRVYWEDTDAGGIVYYANYLRFIERGRSDLLRLLGIDQSLLMDNINPPKSGTRIASDPQGVMFAVRKCTLDYLMPARLDDALVVETGVSRVAGASIDMVQNVRRDENILVRAEVRVACIGRGDGRPRRIPEVVKRHLGSMTEDRSRD